MLNIETTFPSQSTGANASYPFGSAQNVSTPGDASGTPFTKILLDDWLGFQQASMAEAGLTPSNTPDTALNSQLLDALKIIVGVENVNRTITILATDNTAALIQAKLDSVGAVILPDVVITIEWQTATYSIGANKLSLKSFVGGGQRIVKAIVPTGPNAGSKNVIITGTGDQAYAEFPPYSTAGGSSQADQKYLILVAAGDFTLLGDFEFKLTGSTTVTNNACVGVLSGTCSINDCLITNITTTGIDANGIFIFNNAQADLRGNKIDVPTPFGGISACVSASSGGYFEAAGTSGSGEYAYRVVGVDSTFTDDSIAASVATKLEDRGTINS